MPDLSDKVSELAPCPFCGKTDRLKIKPYRADDDGGEPFDWGFTVQCSAMGFDGDPRRGCGSSGAWGETKEEAIAAWNRRTRPPASSMEGWRPQAPTPVINIHLDEPLGEFKPCQLILREAGITEYVYEDCPTVAVPVVAGVYHAVDWMVSFDGRLVGIQFWQIHPELAASPIPPEVMK